MCDSIAAIRSLWNRANDVLSADFSGLRSVIEAAGTVDESLVIGVLFEIAKR